MFLAKLPSKVGMRKVPPNKVVLICLLFQGGSTTGRKKLKKKDLQVRSRSERGIMLWSSAAVCSPVVPLDCFTRCWLHPTPLQRT